MSIVSEELKKMFKCRRYILKRDFPGYITAMSPFPRLRDTFEEGYSEAIRDNPFLLGLYERRKKGIPMSPRCYDRLLQEYKKSGCDEKLACFIFDIFYHLLLYFYSTPYIPFLSSLRETIGEVHIKNTSREKFLIPREHLDGFKSNFQVYLDIATDSASASLYKRFLSFCQFFSLSQFTHVITKALAKESDETMQDRISTIEQDKPKNVGEDYSKKFQVIQLLCEDKSVNFYGQDVLFETTWFIFLSLKYYARVFQCSRLTYNPLREEMARFILKGFGKAEILGNPEEEAYHVLMSEESLKWLDTRPWTSIGEATRILRSLLAPGKMSLIDRFEKEFSQTDQIWFDPAVFEEKK